MFSGLPDVMIGDTLVTNEGGVEAAPPLPPIAVEQPTVRMSFGVNKSPLAGREGKFLTSRMIRDRLFKELDRNVALKVAETDSADRYEVSGRGQLHLTVLIETMRREGFELEIGPPSVIIKEVRVLCVYWTSTSKSNLLSNKSPTLFRRRRTARSSNP